MKQTDIANKAAAPSESEIKKRIDDVVSRIKATEVKVVMVEGKPQTLIPENIDKFIRGELTWAQVQGLSMEHCYAFAEIGYNLFEQGKYDDAQKVFEGLVFLNPYDPYFHAVLGSIFARQNKDDDGLHELTLAVELDPSQPQVLVNRAELYLRKGQFEQAMNDLKTAVSLDSTGNSQAATRAKALAAATAQLISDVLKKQQEAKS